MSVADNALTTLESAKITAGLFTSTTYDAALELFINRVSNSVRMYLGRELTRQTYTEHIPGTNRQLLILKEWPIISITSLKCDDYSLVLNTDYRLDPQDKERGEVYRENGWASSFITSGLTDDPVSAARQLDAIYIAGYYLPKDEEYVEGSATALPLTIQEIVDEEVCERLLRMKTGSNGLSSYSEGGISYGWKGDRSNNGLSDEHAMTLNAFKRFFVS